MSMLNKQDRTPIVLKRVQNVESKKIGRYLHSLLGAHAHGERNDWLLDGEEEILEDMTEGTQKEREVADTQEDLHSILNETGEQKIVYRKEISSNMLIPNSHMTLLRDIFVLVSGLRFAPESGGINCFCLVAFWLWVWRHMPNF